MLVSRDVNRLGKAGSQPIQYPVTRALIYLLPVDYKLRRPTLRQECRPNCYGQGARYLQYCFNGSSETVTESDTMQIVRDRAIQFCLIGPPPY